MATPCISWHTARTLALSGAALFIAASSLLLSIRVPASQRHLSWGEKDWTQWTIYDCDEILRHSPWVTYYEYDDSGIYLTSNSRQFRSALPIRQALLRQLQLEKHYNKMNPQEKQAFDEQHTADLSAVDDGRILLYIANKVSLYPVPTGEFYPLLHNKVPKEPPRQVVLRLSDGSIISPIETTVLKDDEYEREYLYAFPRTVNGKPTYTTSDTSIDIFFGGVLHLDKDKKVVPQQQESFPLDSRSEISFSLGSMIYKSKLEY